MLYIPELNTYTIPLGASLQDSPGQTVLTPNIYDFVWSPPTLNWAVYRVWHKWPHTFRSSPSRIRQSPLHKETPAALRRCPHEEELRSPTSNNFRTTRVSHFESGPSKPRQTFRWLPSQLVSDSILTRLPKPEPPSRDISEFLIQRNRER